MRLLLIMLALAVMMFGLVLVFYDIQFGAAGCDIFVCTRTNHNQGYGINYKREFKFLGFMENN